MTTSSPLADFVPSFATEQLLPPWVSENSTCWCFVIPLPTDCVKTYLGTYFGFAKARFRYAPLDIRKQFGLVVVCVQPNIQRQATANQSQAEVKHRRLMKHTEVYLAIPVVRRDVKARASSAETIVWVEPFAFGDNPYVIFGAREVWGLDMAYATITHTITTDNRAASPELHVDLSIVGMQTFSPQSQAALIPGLRIAAGVAAAPASDAIQSQVPKPVPPPQIPPPGPSDIKEFRDKLGANGYPMPIPPAQVEARTLSAVVSTTVAEPVAHTILLDNLKQFRDVFDMDAAVYRAIVASKVTHTELGRIIQYDPTQVELDFFWSASAQEMLTSLFGVEIPPPSDDFIPCRLPVALAYSFTSNVKFEVKGTIFECRPPGGASNPGFGGVQTS
jgi:hypothetical protein